MMRDHVLFLSMKTLWTCQFTCQFGILSKCNLCQVSFAINFINHYNRFLFYCLGELNDFEFKCKLFHCKDSNSVIVSFSKDV